MSRRLAAIGHWAAAHRRLLAVFFGSLGWALRGSIHAAAHDLDNANLTLFALGCAALGAYYLAFVLGWIRILAEWGIPLSYPAALRAEMISMLAKYIPGGIWTPAARVVAARRAGVTDAALVTSSMLLEAGLSAVAGVIVFVVGLAFVDDVDAPLAPLVVPQLEAKNMELDRACAFPVPGHGFHHELVGGDDGPTRDADLSRRRAA